MTKQVICPYCENTMMLVHLSNEFPPDIKYQYVCLRCQATAPKAVSEQDALDKAITLRKRRKKHE